MKRLAVLLALLVAAQPALALDLTPPGGYRTVADEGTALTPRRRVNFIGAGISCVDDAATPETDCTVSGGTPGGTSGQLQWNNADTFAGVSGSDAGTAGRLLLNNGANAQPPLVVQDNGTAVFTVADVAGTAANGVTVTGGLAGTRPIIAMTGTDANRGIILAAKGADNVVLRSNARDMNWDGSALTPNADDADDLGSDGNRFSFVFAGAHRAYLSMTGSDPVVAGAANWGGNGAVFEGATADAFETTLAFADPTADRTFTFPNVLSGDVAITLSGSATIDFASIAGETCAASTITVTGAALNDLVALGIPNAAMDAGSMFNAWVSVANTVSVRHCCTGAAIANCDPASGTFKVKVVL